MSRRRAGLALAGFIAAAPAGAAEPAACTGEAAFSALDFWVGDWDVCVDGRLAGHDRVAKVLDGCAVSEAWTDVDGSHGQSLFYYVVSEKQWKQVWVTDRALHPGGLKEKRLVARFADGGLRFQGEIALPDGRRLLDRTTLRPAPAASVTQRIEVSRDGGDTWTATFDARYRRAPDPGCS